MKVKSRTFQKDFMHHPLAFLAVFFACGIAVSRFFSVDLLICYLFVAISFTLSILLFLQRNLKQAKWAIAIAFFFAGYLFVLVETEGKQTDNIKNFYETGFIKSGDPVEITGVLAKDPETAVGLIYLTLKIEKLRFKEEEKTVSGVLRLSAPIRGNEALSWYEDLELRYGARIRLMTTIFTEESFRNPGVNSFTEFLEQRGYDLSATIKSPLLVKRLDDERVFLPRAWLYKFRTKVLAQIMEKFSPETAGVLAASLLGNRYYLSQSTAERFREGGTFHVLVISGLHISFIGFIVFLLMRRLTKNRTLQFAVPVSIVWAYSLMVGAEASVVRAALMFTVVSFAPVINRERTSLNSLGGAAIVLLAYRPGDLFDPSFQLTFVSVLAIVSLAWTIIEKLNAIGTWQPSAETPYPPDCSIWIRRLSECLYWSEKAWQKEQKRSTWKCNLFKTPLAEKLERFRLQKLFRHSFEALTVSFSVLVLMLPLMVLYFHRLSFIALLLNIFVEAFVAAMCLSAIVGLILSQFSEMFSLVFIYLSDIFNYIATHSVDPFSKYQIASIRLPEYSGFASCIYVIYYLPVIASLYFLAKWNPLSSTSSSNPSLNGRSFFDVVSKPAYTLTALLILFSIIVFHPFSSASATGRLRVDFIDVGQGDSALVTMPDGTRILIDGGGRPQNFGQTQTHGNGDEEPFTRDTRSIGEAVVSEFLWHEGLDSIDYIIATHADYDHIDGLNDIAKNFSVKEALVGRTPVFDIEFAEFAKTLKKRGVPLSVISRGDVLKFGEAAIEILHPTKTDAPNAPSKNNDSLTFIIRYGTRAFLFTGDIENQIEKSLSVYPDDLLCDVVKVPHHGSKTSSSEDFINATQAKFAVISVGLLSPFGHPNKEVVERWKANGAVVITTGQKGTITISTDGNDLKIETFVF